MFKGRWPATGAAGLLALALGTASMPAAAQPAGVRVATLSDYRDGGLLTAQMFDDGDDLYESVYRGAPGPIGPLLSKALKDPEIEAALTSRRDRRFVLEVLSREINAERVRAVGRASRRA